MVPVATGLYEDKTAPVRGQLPKLVLQHGCGVRRVQQPALRTAYIGRPRVPVAVAIHQTVNGQSVWQMSAVNQTDQTGLNK